MIRSQKLLCLVYAAIAIFALLGTWSQNIHYMKGLADFLVDAKANPAARSVTVDVFLVALSASFFMVWEARRLGMRFVWAYIFFGFTVAISFTFPLFLVAREFKLGGDKDAVTLLDKTLLFVVTAVAAFLYWFALFR